MNFEKISILLEKAMIEKGSNTYKLEELTGMTRRYIRSILKEEKGEKGSKDAIEKLLLALELNEKERINIWASWMFQKGFYEIAEFLKKNNK